MKATFNDEPAANIVLAKAGANTLAIQILSFARLRQYFSVVRNLALSNHRTKDLTEDKKILQAFPSALNKDVIEVLNKSSIRPNDFSSTYYLVIVNEEELLLPYRIYHDESALGHLESLKHVQKNILYCLFSRHHDGFTRQKCISKIINSQYDWSIPFIIQAIGEYVVEILVDIFENRHEINKHNFKNFILSNRAYYGKTKDRVSSYWDCYYRIEFPKKKDYVGFKILEWIDNVVLNYHEH